jgi:uncharacterized protein
MEYRDFGKTGYQVSALGFGCMRLPTTDGKPFSPNIIEDQAVRIIRHAIDQGVNYVDTAYPYHGGNSEVVLGKALLGGYREKVRIADKSPVWLIQSEGDFDNFLNEQLHRLQAQHIEYYMLHALNQQRWRDIVLKYDILKKAQQAVRDGRIGCLGFSFHDAYGSFPEILNGFDAWTFCQIQYNYMDTENQAGTKGLKLAADNGLAVVVMEPLLGGRLASPPAAVRQIIDEFPVKRTAVDWALQWVWNQPEVSLVLSGMNSMDQVEQNITSACRSRVGCLDGPDLEVIAKLQQKYQERMVIPCTRCGYCMPCPNGVDIPTNFQMYNEGSLHEDLPGARFLYQVFVAESARASACVSCAVCESECPQRIKISEWMPKVHSVLGEL